MTTTDKTRKALKATAIRLRLWDMRGNEDLLLNLLDETKLDMVILALGIGVVVLHDEEVAK